MGKFTPEEAAAEINEARATLARPPFADRSRISDEDQIRHCVGFAEPRVESRNERHRREITEQERRFEIERERERVREERREARTHGEPLLLATNQRLGALEASMLDLARGSNKLAEGVSAELDTLRIENTELKTNLARLEAKLAQIELQAVEARSKIVDLPALPRMQ